MIVFDLRCRSGHVFEAWFASSAAFDSQRADGQLACPVCGDGAIEKAVMAPAVPAKGNCRTDHDSAAATDRQTMLRRLADAQQRMLQSSTWVGPRFAQQAREMHEGETKHAPIHGQATIAEAKSLAADGVPIVPLPFPVIPPDKLN